MFVLLCQNAQFWQMGYFITLVNAEINFALLNSKRKQMKESKTCNPQYFLLRLRQFFDGSPYKRVNS